MTKRLREIVKMSIETHILVVYDTRTRLLAQGCVVQAKCCNRLKSDHQCSLHWLYLHVDLPTHACFVEEK